jgi:glutathionylspermidine synthase
MSAVIKYVELELRLAHLFSNVAEKGFVMPDDRQVLQDGFAEYMENSRSLWEEQIPDATISFFDAHTLVENPATLHELCVIFIHSQLVAQDDKAMKRFNASMTLETFRNGSRDRSAGLMELAENDDFLVVLEGKSLDTAQRLAEYVAQKTAEHKAGAASNSQRPAEHDVLAAEMSERARTRLLHMLETQALPNPTL